jgi:putative membrane protein
MGRIINKQEDIQMVTTIPVLLAALLYSVVGMLVLCIGFFIFDALTPGKLWEDIRDKQNMAVAQFAGLFALGLSIIVAAAIHG